MRFFLIFRLFVTALFAATLLLGSAQPAQAQLLDWTTGEGEDVCVKQVTLTNNANGIPGEGDPVKEVATLQGIGCLVRNILAVTTTFIGLAAFVMLIMGAFLYLTSGGQSKHIDAAKQAITYAVIGIVVALMAFFILNLVATFTGARGILRFDIFVESTPGNTNQQSARTPCVNSQCQAGYYCAITVNTQEARRAGLTEADLNTCRPQLTSGAECWLGAITGQCAAGLSCTRNICQ